MNKSKVLCKYIKECIGKGKCSNCIHNEAFEEKNYFEEAVPK